MLNLVIGQNTIGKTLFLERELKKQNLKSLGTNLIKNTLVNKGDYNLERIEALKDVLLTDEIVLGSSILGINDSLIKCSEEFVKLLTIICKDKDVIYLDEPEKILSLTEKNLFINFLNSIKHTFKDIWISTHYELFLNIPEKNVFTVQMSDNTSDLKLLSIDRSKWYEVID